jgi:hypothetical protein
MAARIAISTASRSSLPVLRWSSKTSRSSALTSLSTSCRIVSAVFFPGRQSVFDRPCAADFFIDFEQFTAQFPETVKGLDFALRLAHPGGRGKSFADRFPIHFAREPEVGAVARLVGLMTTALPFPTATADGRDGTAAKITHIDDAGQNGAPLLFERNQRVWRVAPPFLTYQYIRNIATKKKPLIVALSCRAPHERR